MRLTESISFQLTFALVTASLLPSASAQFVQQAELVGSGAVASADQGFSVALSGDGNTAIMGGRFDNAKSEQRGCSRARVACGPSKAAN